MERKEFLECLQEVCRFGKTDNFIEWQSEQGDTKGGWRCRIFLYTRTHRYKISAIVHSNKDYLGCTVSARMPRAGETWTRGNDLPDGSCSRRTWENIKNSIIQYELVKITKSAREPVVDSN